MSNVQKLIESRGAYPLTMQEAFNYIWQHFIIEKNPQGKLDGRNNTCCYASNCAVGCLIPQEVQKEWDDDEEDSSISNIAHSHENYFKYFQNDMLDFLMDCQKSHDLHFETFEDELRTIAGQFNLKIPVEDKP